LILGKLLVNTWIMSSRVFFLILLAVFCGAGGGAFGQQIRTLEEFKTALLKNSPQVRVSQESLGVSTRLKKSAFGALLPSLDLSSSLLADHTTDPEPLDATGTSLKLSANFFNSQFDWFNYKISRFQERASELQYYTDVSALVLNGIDLYLDYSDRYVALETSRQRQQLINEQYRISRRSYRSGTSTRLDFMRLQSEIKSSEFEVRRAETEYEKAENRLRALFQNSSSELTFKPLVFDMSESLPEIKESLPVEEHPEYQIEINRVKAAELEVKKAQRRYWPQISFGTELTEGLSGYWVENDRAHWGRDWVTTLTLTFNLFDGGQRSYDLANQRSEVIIGESKAELARLKLDADVKNLHIEGVRLKDQVKNAVEILRIDTQVFQSISHEYQVGNMGYLDFINALNQRLSSQLNLQTSISSYLKTYYNSLYYKGILVDE